MGFKTVCFGIFLSLAIGFAQSSRASELAVERDILSRLQQLSENQQLLLQDQEQTLIEFQRKLDNAQQDLKIAEQDLASKSQSLAQLQQAGPAKARERKLMAHSVAMARRAAKNRLKRVKRIEGKLVQEKQLLTKATTQMSNSRIALRKQEAKIAALQAQLKAQASSKNVSAAQAKTRVQSKTVALNKPTVTSKIPSTQRPTLAQTMAKTAVAKPSELEKPNTAAASEPPSGPVLAQSSSKAPVLKSNKTEPPQQQLAELDELARQQAQAEQQRLEKALAGPKRSGRKLYNNLRIQSGAIDAGFEYLGNHQYRAETPVNSGRHRFTVGSHYYRGTIPEADAGEVYVFLFDTSRKGKPRLSMYRKSLLP